MTSRALAVAAWESLFRTQVAVMRTLTAEFPSKEVTLSEYDVLFTVSREPGRRIRMRDLNRHVLLTQPSVSRMVDRLATRGLLTKSTDPTDGRGTIVGLTPEGLALFRRVAHVHMNSIFERVGNSLSDDELAQLIVMCDRLRGDNASSSDYSDDNDDSDSSTS